MELCAAHPHTKTAGFGLVSQAETHYHFRETFLPRLNIEGQNTYGRWSSQTRREIVVLCTQHLPEVPNSRSAWFKDFVIEHPESDYYMETFEALMHSANFGYMKNINSLMIKKDGQWVRVLDGATVEYTPVTRIYPVRIFELFELPLPDQSKLDLPDKKTLTVHSSLDDLDSQIDQEAWDKLFD